MLGASDLTLISGPRLTGRTQYWLDAGEQEGIAHKKSVQRALSLKPQLTLPQRYQAMPSSFLFADKTMVCLKLTGLACALVFTAHLTPLVLTCGTKLDSCLYVKTGMVVDPSAPSKPVEQYGDIEMHADNDGRSRRITGCLSGTGIGFCDDKGRRRLYRRKQQDGIPCGRERRVGRRQR